MTGIPKSSFVETVFDMPSHPGTSGRRPLLQPEQKHISLMGYIIHKFTTSCHRMLEPYLGPGATEKDCLLEPNHRKIFRCDVDSDYATKMIPSVFFRFAEQVFNPDSDIAGSGDVHNAARVYRAEQRAAVVHRQTV